MYCNVLIDKSFSLDQTKQTLVEYSLPGDTRSHVYNEMNGKTLVNTSKLLPRDIILEKLIYDKNHSFIDEAQF
jgi:hypothetical protein